MSGPAFSSHPYLLLFPKMNHSSPILNILCHVAVILPRPLILLISLAKQVYFCISKSNHPLQPNVPILSCFYTQRILDLSFLEFLQHPGGINCIIYYFLFVLPSLHFGSQCSQSTDTS